METEVAEEKFEPLPIPVPQTGWDAMGLAGASGAFRTAAATLRMWVDKHGPMSAAVALSMAESMEIQADALLKAGVEYWDGPSNSPTPKEKDKG